MFENRVKARRGGKSRVRSVRQFDLFESVEMCSRYESSNIGQTFDSGRHRWIHLNEYMNNLYDSEIMEKNFKEFKRRFG